MGELLARFKFRTRGMLHRNGQQQGVVVDKVIVKVGRGAAVGGVH